MKMTVEEALAKTKVWIASPEGGQHETNSSQYQTLFNLIG